MVTLHGVTYGPPWWRPFAILAAALLAAGAALVIVEMWALVAVLVFAMARDFWSRPALTLQADGFGYVAGLHRQFADWQQIEAIRVRRERHFLAWGTTVEIDLSDETLIVLSQAQLGAEPDEVARVLENAWQEAVNSAKPS